MTDDDLEPIYARTRATIGNRPIDDRPIGDRQIDNRLIGNCQITREIEGVIPFTFEESFQRWTVRELRDRFVVNFARTPSSERMIFNDAIYLGQIKVWNEKYRCDYETHLWIVYFDRANHTDFETPLRGLLMIRAKIWQNTDLPNQVTACIGKCVLVADKNKQILSFRSSGDSD